MAVTGTNPQTTPSAVRIFLDYVFYRKTLTALYHHKIDYNPTFKATKNALGRQVHYTPRVTELDPDLVPGKEYAMTRAETYTEREIDLNLDTHYEAELKELKSTNVLFALGNIYSMGRVICSTLQDSINLKEYTFVPIPTFNPWWENERYKSDSLFFSRNGYKNISRSPCLGDGSDPVPDYAPSWRRWTTMNQGYQATGYHPTT
ncbi:hypothetical protein BO94DRAFT_549365 [Aspergillus sclerotioniger CBS 115572]|uniref:Uncharacterized protein n=1 Tax=Aspergillus sclerotioniger CBS 115572 TaxID=1450535 RepID=A0A317VSZ0_9EURO|nr:hypothetical protein BO94DRAFT_549365 [Aspergillus sclerotioniger CBS 115572]PWY76052.1 hypothetical protein BO94DRAFT_549365 [Aspergillus sclerotioniger CBS 115572]